jgi:hypothetical protein
MAEDTERKQNKCILDSSTSVLPPTGRTYSIYHVLTGLLSIRKFSSVSQYVIKSRFEEVFSLSKGNPEYSRDGWTRTALFPGKSQRKLMKFDPNYE